MSLIPVGPTTGKTLLPPNGKSKSIIEILQKFHVDYRVNNLAWGGGDAVIPDLARQAGLSVAQFTEQLILAVRNPDIKVRHAALSLLSEIGQVRGKDSRQEILPRLIGALSSPDIGVRQAAASSLGHMGPDAKEAMKPLLGIVAYNRFAIDLESKDLLRKALDALDLIATREEVKNAIVSDSDLNDYAIEYFLTKPNQTI